MGFYATSEYTYTNWAILKYAVFRITGGFSKGRGHQLCQKLDVES